MSKFSGSDSGVYLVARYLAFFIAATASIMFSIFLFLSLDPGWAPLLCSLALALECARLTTAISINVVKSLHLKLQTIQLQKRIRQLFIWYLIYGFLSVLSSLGFSTYITARTQAVRDSGIEILASRQFAIENKMNEIVLLQQSASITSYLEYPPYIEANNEYQEFNRRYEEADLLDTQLRLVRDQIIDKTGEQYVIANNEYQAQRTFLSGVRSQRQRAESERSRIQLAFESSKEDMQGELSKLNGQLVTLIQQAGIEATDGNVALIILQEQIQNAEILAIQEKGMTYMFEGFSKYTNGLLSPEAVKFLILMLAALLLELTIYQCAPDVKISAWILKYFRRSLPSDKTFREILDLYKDENIDTIEVEKPIEIISPEPEVVTTLDATFNKPVKLEFEPVVEKSVKVRKTRKKKEVIEEPVKKQRKPRKKKVVVDMPAPPLDDKKIEHVVEQVIDQLKEEERDVDVITDIATLVPSPIISPFKDYSKEEIAEMSKPVTFEEVTEEQIPDPENDTVEKVDKEAFDQLFPTDDEEPVNQFPSLMPPGQTEIMTEKDFNELYPADDKAAQPYTPTEKELEEIKKEADSKKLIQYRFGKTTPAVIEKLSKFVDLCIDQPGLFIMSPDVAAAELGLSRKAKEVFIDHLLNLKLEGKSLIRQEFNEYFSNFTANRINEYATQIVS